MLRPTVIQVEPLPRYRLLLAFDNGERKMFDVTPLIQGEWYGKLKDMSYFNRVEADGFTVVWPDGQDLCPDDLYYNSSASKEA